MPMNSTVDYPVYSHSYIHKSTLSWGAIIAGTVMALSLSVLFNLLGMALGFSVFSPDTNTISNIGMGSLIWLAFTGIVSIFFGGWVAGKSTQFGLKLHGALHGLLTWGVATLFIVLLTTTAASAIITAGAVSVMNKDVRMTLQQNNANPNVATTKPTMNQNNVQLQNPLMRQNIEEASSALGSIAFAAFIIFLLSAIAGAIGGYLGGLKNHCEYRREVNTPNVNTNV